MPYVTEFKIHCPELDEAIKLVTRAPRGVTRAIRKGIYWALADIREIARDTYAPVGWGDLQNAIAIYPIITVSDILIRGSVVVQQPAGEDKYYPVFVEYGTKPYTRLNSSGEPLLPPENKIRRWSFVSKKFRGASRKDLYRLRMYIYKHGMRAHPFIRPTVVDRGPVVGDFIRIAVKDEIGKVLVKK